MPDSPPLPADPWLRDLSPEVVAHLQAMSVRRRLRDGELLYARGDAAEGLYGVVSGRIRLSVPTASGREMLIVQFEPGSWFGEVSMFDGQPRPQDARAAGDSDILLLPRARFLALLEQHPELYRGFTRLLCRKLRTALEYVEDALTLPLAARLGKRLLELARVYGVEREHGRLIDLPLPQDDLANMLGATRQSVSKQLKAWEQRGWIALRYRHVVVRDEGALQRAVARWSQGATE
ncbi:Crp/Fnr family transcriptional regulator [Lysobacter sp. K5869]|uniref:Crp/Fnr family transcriptional regulator n=1 Tax=Lysobacter sp. K5869 TaxID=2820808 RepID=UPI001C064218|nr:Crp/Fnr family transcriptional regulator [Lysobacter sp. K5869]QWP78934.1 Crp/Fnr family transcriptional regulator [Lysobacter sp. K5869]